MMKLTFLQTRVFLHDWKAMRFGDDELRSLELLLMRDPLAGKVISHSGGVRKIRFAPAGRGKSGSARVVYLHYPAHGRIYLLLAFGKDEQADLGPEDKKFCREMTDGIKKELTKGKS
jgi:hypothetical protein